MPLDARGRMEVMQWLFWQVAGLGPMLGQLVFYLSNKEKYPFSIGRYTKESERLFGVMNKRLEDRKWLAGEHYSIADIAAYGWAGYYNHFGLTLDKYASVERWLEAIASRSATERAYALGKTINPQAPLPLRRAERDASSAAV